jgi:hypothetical protein
VEQRSLQKHLPREKIIGTKTRSPSTTSHPNKIHPKSATGGTKHQTTIGRKATTGRNPLETKIQGSMAKRGGKNTKFFHRSMIHRRFINHITKLENAQGTTLLSHLDITKELTDYYLDLLSEPQVDHAEAIGKVTTNIPTLITQEHNEALMTPISQAEVDQAIQELPTGKAPGPDGFTMDFFHACWPMLRDEVWKLVEESRSSGKVLPTLNATFLTLIPKEERVTNPKIFRPIALCNVIYKIISKVIALRLKPILPFIISKEQSGYVEGRQIMDSVILVHEVIHSLKSTRTPGMLLKLDLSKYFDKLSWHYIREILAAFGFSAN